MRCTIALTAEMTWCIAVAGGAPLFIGERAFEKLTKRKSKVSSYYFDLNLVGVSPRPS